MVSEMNRFKRKFCIITELSVRKFPYSALRFHATVNMGNSIYDNVIQEIYSTH